MFFVDVEWFGLIVHICQFVFGCRSRDFVDLARKIGASTSTDLFLEINCVLNFEWFSYRVITVNIVKLHLYICSKVRNSWYIKIASSFCKYIEWKGRSVVFCPYWTSNLQGWWKDEPSSNIDSQNRHHLHSGLYRNEIRHK